MLFPLYVGTADRDTVSAATQVHEREINFDANNYYISVAVLLLALNVCGIIGNIISFLVLKRIETRCSSYTYLTVLSASSLGYCCVLLIAVINTLALGGLQYTLFLSIPLAAIMSGINVCATVGVTLDRLLVLRKPTRPTPPPICRVKVARRIMKVTSVLTILFNIPYFFIFVVREDGSIHTSNFFTSRFYFFYNWIGFIMYGIIPLLFLLIATGLLIASIKRVSEKMRHLFSKRPSVQDSSRMTWTLIAIAVFFLLGEFSNHIISKKSAFIFLSAGDVNTVNSHELDLVRAVGLVLGTVNCSINFLLYIMLYPPFYRELRHMFRRRNEPIGGLVDLQMNVFIVSYGLDMRAITDVLPMFSDLVVYTAR